MTSRNKGKSKSSKKTNEELSTDENKGSDSVITTAEKVQEQLIEVSVSEKDITPPSTPPPKPSEPPLWELIVESYDGEMQNGLYQGNGTINFQGGNFYEGTFKNGMLDGVGEYHWSNGIIYNGEFQDNQIIGKGMFTWPDKSTYIGEVYMGKRHGQGVFTVEGSSLSYEGEWTEGERHGKGCMRFDPEGRSYYAGDWVRNVKHGYGTRLYSSGNVYVGMWQNGIRQGKGEMEWLDRRQKYIGNWDNGVQHGRGQHVWFLRRVPGSQYALRNMYDGEFVRGERHGLGTFYYANGSRYEGEWRNNVKQGKGKFTFKNGRIYEGNFENDHIVDYPNQPLDHDDCSNDLHDSNVHPNDDVVSHFSIDSRSSALPNFQLNIQHVLDELADEDREEENHQVMCVLLRYSTLLRKIYNYYSSLGVEESADNTHALIRLQFWRFLKDCHLHNCGFSLIQLDRLLSDGYHNLLAYAANICRADIHNPYDKLLYREFCNHLIILSFYIYRKQFLEKKVEAGKQCPPLLATCLNHMISNNIIPHVCNVKGYMYQDPRHAPNILVHAEHAYEVYQSACSTAKVEPWEPTLKMRDFLYFLKDMKLLDENLSTSKVIEVLSENDKNVYDGKGCFSLEIEMTFLEFLEALVGCAQYYVTEAMLTAPELYVDGTQLIEKSLESDQNADVQSIKRDDTSGEILDDGLKVSSDDAKKELVPPKSDTPKSQAGDEHEKHKSRGGASSSHGKQEGSGKKHGDKKHTREKKSTSDAPHGKKVHRASDKASRKKAGADNLPAEDGKSTAERGKGVGTVEGSNKRETSMGSESGSKPGGKTSAVSDDVLPYQETEPDLTTQPENPALNSAQDQPILTAEGTNPNITGGKTDIPALADGFGENEFGHIEEDTKLFNFWTHQLHYFFVVKFFPRASRYILLKKKIYQQVQAY